MPVSSFIECTSGNKVEFLFKIMHNKPEISFQFEPSVLNKMFFNRKA